MKFLIGLVYLVNLCAISFSIHCYECNSKVDPSCLDPFRVNSNSTKESFLVDCDSKDSENSENKTSHTLCRKVLTYVEGYNMNMERVQRECGIKWRKGDADYVKRSEDYQIYIYQCGTDECNTAPQDTASKTALFLVPFFIYRYV